MTALQCYGMTVITALTAQNTMGVQAVEGMLPGIVQQQLSSIVSDIGIDAIKTGMLFSQETISVVADTLQQHYSIDQHPPLCLDPVCVSTSGHTLLPTSAIETLKDRLFPWATIITPNLPEAELLAGMSSGSVETLEDMRRCAVILGTMGCRWILIKGGHCKQSESVVVDLLWDAVEQREVIFEHGRIETTNTHGTGCTLSAAIACFLAQGHSGMLPSFDSDFHQYILRTR